VPLVGAGGNEIRGTDARRVSPFSLAPSRWALAAFAPFWRPSEPMGAWLHLDFFRRRLRRWALAAFGRFQPPWRPRLAGDLDQLGMMQEAVEDARVTQDDARDMRPTLPALGR